jgi:hypothetical protein
VEADGFGRDDWLKAVGGFAFFVFGLLTWWELTSPDGLTFTTNALDFQLTGLVPYVIFVAIAILTLLGKTHSLRLAERLLHPLVFLIAAAAGTVLVGYRLFESGWDVETGYEASRGIGLYGCFVAALLVLAGCILTYRNDLVGEYEDEDDEYDDEDDVGGETPPATREDATPRGPERPPIP